MAQHHIRARTSDKRRQAWQRGWSDPEHASTGLTERTIPIFRALIDAPDSEDNERRLSQLAYALKDQDIPDWEGAFEYIDKAINLVGEQRGVPHHYNYTWALAAIHKLAATSTETTETAKSVEKIESRLRAGLEFKPLRQGFQKKAPGQSRQHRQTMAD